MCKRFQKLLEIFAAAHWFFPLSLIFIEPSLGIPDTLATDRVVSVDATVSESPPSITLHWDQPQPSSGIVISKKQKNEVTWAADIANLPGTATMYVDTDVEIGMGYEYKVWSNSLQEGYVYSGIRLPMVEDRGIVNVVVDNTHSASLEMELERLRYDLIGDGWEVIMDEVSPSDTVVDIKNSIVAHYNSEPNRMKTVLLLGDVPVPYSGNFAPDGHSNHVGAWPADCFYADMDGNWNDLTVTNTSAAGTRNDNVPGDGKYDHNVIPTDPELAVGRVDLSKMTWISTSETELLRRYLNKDHTFRHKEVTVPPRALVKDSFLSRSEGFAQSGWRLASSVGVGNVDAANWSQMLTEEYLWGYGCGGGSFTSAGGVVGSGDYATKTYKVMFQMLFGSYFGDWDVSNNLLRASLTNQDYGLTCCWAGRPHFNFHHMSMGETIGYCVNLSLTFPPYIRGSRIRGVHVALMGDPTLRLHPVAPPQNLESAADGGNTVLTWQSSAEPVEGYHVYRSDSMEGPYERITDDPVTENTYSDTDPPEGESAYMIRALKLEQSASGTYYNLSQGVFSGQVFNFGEPSLAVEGWGLYR